MLRPLGLGKLFNTINNNRNRLIIEKIENYEMECELGIDDNSQETVFLSFYPIGKNITNNMLKIEQNIPTIGIKIKRKNTKGEIFITGIKDIINEIIKIINTNNIKKLKIKGCKNVFVMFGLKKKNLKDLIINDSRIKPLISYNFNNLSKGIRNMSLSGGKSYVKIPKVGLRKIRYFKNGKKYIIVNKKKIKL